MDILVALVTSLTVTCMHVTFVLICKSVDSHNHTHFYSNTKLVNSVMKGNRRDEITFCPRCHNTRYSQKSFFFFFPDVHNDLYKSHLFVASSNPRGTTSSGSDPSQVAYEAAVKADIHHRLLYTVLGTTIISKSLEW